MTLKQIATALILLILFLAAQPVLSATADEPLQYPGFQRDAEQEYYRGIFDTCVWAMAKAGAGRGDATMQCLLFVRQAQDSDWYEQPSTGWPRDLRRLPAGWGNTV